MTTANLLPLLPLLITGLAVVVVMLAIAVHRDHRVSASLTLLGFAAALATLPLAYHSLLPGRYVFITPLLIIDGYSLYYTGLILATGFVVTLLSFGYLEKLPGKHDEYYLLLLLASLGSAVLTASAHFASFFLGLELLSVSLYALIAYQRGSRLGIEAALKYLILAGVSSPFILFGMALIYANLGTMEPQEIAIRLSMGVLANMQLSLVGLVMILVGVGFKLSLVPFHLWAPDVYEGAPAPVTALIATTSKGAVFALLVRYFMLIDTFVATPLILIFTVLAIASMFVGNLLGLLQHNVKRILAYSSISHMGYLLVAFLASGRLAVTAITFYITAYFITTLGAFGTITVLSDRMRDADTLEDYRGLAWRRPWLAALFTAMLLSLAGIPLTAGFVGKFFLLTAGVSANLWLLVIILVINSAIGLFYYLRIVLTMYLAPEGQEAAGTPVPPRPQPLPLAAGIVLGALVLLLVWFGVYPAQLIDLIDQMVASLF